MEHIVVKCCLDPKLQIFFIYSVRILDILEVKAKKKRVFSKITKCSILTFPFSLLALDEPEKK